MSRKQRAPPAGGNLDIEASHSSPLPDEETSGSDHSFDILSALTQRKSALHKGKAPLLSHDDGMDDDDTDLEEMIRTSISKRNVKNGTELLKNTKGKKGLTKGELGGGSFQSMGTPFQPVVQLGFDPIIF
jgi:ERCC4-type nuclease